MPSNTLTVPFDVLCKGHLQWLLRRHTGALGRGYFNPPFPPFFPLLLETMPAMSGSMLSYARVNWRSSPTPLPPPPLAALHKASSVSQYVELCKSQLEESARVERCKSWLEEEKCNKLRRRRPED
jgi:hypothetical protein